MRILFGFVILLALLLLGDSVSAFLPMPVSVSGAVVIGIAAACSQRVRDFLSPSAGLLVRWIPLFFVPALVGIILKSEVFVPHLALILFAVFGSSLLALLGCALVWRLAGQSADRQAPENAQAKNRP